MGVVLCLLLLIPGNMLIHHIAGDVNVVASLPPQAALILPAALTVLFGLLPGVMLDLAEPALRLMTPRQTPPTAP